MENLKTSLVALLVAEACNIGLTPVIDPEDEALTRGRLVHVDQYYLRADTIAAANAKLIEAQARVPIVSHWGEGLLASVDGLRFVVPKRTINASPSPKYYQESNAKWTVAENNITSLDDDTRRQLLGVEIDRKALAEIAARPRAATAIVDLPAGIDWRNVHGRNHVSPVKDQLHCGSCVSFCVCATTESVVSIAGGEVIDLSEADLHFCSSHGTSCGGWWPSDALSEAQRRGITTEALFPYASAFDAAGNPSCQVHPNRDQQLYRPSGFSTLTTMAERKQWLASRGPVCAVLHVYDDFFPLRGEVYRHLTGGHAGYHCVEVVGYSDADSCWIAKNSWGPAWGDNGFFRIAYGECGIDETSNDRDPDGSLNRFPMFGIEGVLVPGGWKGFELAGAGSASLTGSISAVSRIPGSMELWWVGGNGSVQAAYWYEGAQWQRYELAPEGSASPTGSISAVSRIPNSMELWWTGVNGTVRDNFWYP